MAVRVFTIFIVSLIALGQIFAQPPRSTMMVGQRAGSFIFRPKPTKEQKKRLMPDEPDLRKYEKFLEQPKTGIFRLLPDIGCTENVNIIKADEECLNFIPESSYYSFREKEHTIEMLADIRLKDGYLISDGILAQGILVNLGELEFEKTGGENEGLKFLANYSPGAQSVEVQKQYIQIVQGIKVGKYEFRKVVPVVENTTYALRVIAYKGNIYRVFRGFRYDLLDGDKRIDLILLFRVIRQGTDGGITLLWKELERREAPRIIFPKRKK